VHGGFAAAFAVFFAAGMSEFGPAARILEDS